MYIARNSAFVLVFCCYCLINHVQGYMKGAPIDVCTTLEPKHGKPPQDSPSPYTFRVKPACIKKGMNATVTVDSGSPEVTFKGFLVQGREDTNIVNGLFSQLPENTQPLECAGGQSNTVTHSNNTERTTLSFQWTPPENYIGAVTFTGTVVQGGQVHWCGIVSNVLLVK